MKIESSMSSKIQIIISEIVIELIKNFSFCKLMCEKAVSKGIRKKIKV